MSFSNSSNGNDVILAVSFYLVTSITMVLANKWVLKYLPDLPLFFLWLQIIIAVMLIAATQFFGFITFTKSGKGLPRINIVKAQRLIPLIAINVIGLAFNTYCLVFIDASMYQVARSLILPLTVILQYSILRIKSSFSIVIACAIVCLGFVVGLFMDENGASSENQVQDAGFKGIVFGVLSSFTTALHSIVIKSSMDVVEGNTLELVWYNNALSALALFPIVVLSGELSSLRKWLDDNSDNIHSSEVRIIVFGTFITGIFGFLINLAGFFQIKITSPVTHMISSAVRGVLQTFLAVWLFGELLTASRLWGIFLILFGSSLYTWLKANQAPPPTTNSNNSPV